MLAMVNANTTDIYYQPPKIIITKDTGENNKN